MFRGFTNPAPPRKGCPSCAARLHLAPHGTINQSTRHTRPSWATKSAAPSRSFSAVASSDSSRNAVSSRVYENRCSRGMRCSACCGAQRQHRRRRRPGRGTRGNRTAGLNRCPHLAQLATQSRMMHRATKKERLKVPKAMIACVVSGAQSKERGGEGKARFGKGSETRRAQTNPQTATHRCRLALHRLSVFVAD